MYKSFCLTSFYTIIQHLNSSFSDKVYTHTLVFIDPKTNSTECHYYKEGVNKLVQINISLYENIFKVFYFSANIPFLSTC